MFRLVTRREAELPSIVVGDSGNPVGKQFFTVLDNLIHERRVPPIVAILIGAGGQDAQGSERGFEYDAVNGAYAEFVENEVLPLAESHADVRAAARIPKAGRQWASVRADRRRSRWPGSTPSSTIVC